MNEATYEQRRKVMKYVYEFKKINDFGRVNVRIIHNPTGCKSNVLGVGPFGQFNIFIAEKALDLSEAALRAVVFHEIGHAAFGLRHDDECCVMKATIDTKNPPSKSSVNNTIKGWSQ